MPRGIESDIGINTKYFKYNGIPCNIALTKTANNAINEYKVNIPYLSSHLSLRLINLFNFFSSSVSSFSSIIE